MNLSTPRAAKGSTRKRKRIGRGVGSGKGGHSSTRGNKGQKSRTGNNTMPAWFEGGQMPLQRRIPKYGFINPFRKEFRVINLSRLTQLVEAGRVDPLTPITPAVLCALGQAHTSDKIKILGEGTLAVALQVSAHAFSRSARQKIETVGGKAIVVG